MGLNERGVADILAISHLAAARMREERKKRKEYEKRECEITTTIPPDVADRVKFIQGSEPPKSEQILAASKNGGIQQAAQWMIDGRRVKRAVWSDDVHDDNYHRPCLLYKGDRRVMTVSRGGNNWSGADLTVDDLLATDWEIVEEKTGIDAAVEKSRELGKKALVSTRAAI